MYAPPEKRRTAPAGTEGGSIINSSKNERLDYSSPTSSAATPASNLISIEEACRRSDEKPVTILGWIVHDKIGKHVKTGRGHGGDWMVDPGKLERLLAEQAVAS